MRQSQAALAESPMTPPLDPDPCGLPAWVIRAIGTPSQPMRYAPGVVITYGFQFELCRCGWGWSGAGRDTYVRNMVRMARHANRCEAVKQWRAEKAAEIRSALHGSEAIVK